MPYKYLALSEPRPGVRLIEFNNAPAHTINVGGVTELADVLSRLQQDIAEGREYPRVLALTGGLAAQKANKFIQSYDVGELSQRAEGELPSFGAEASGTVSLEHKVNPGFDDITQCFERLPLMTVACINGLAMGGGCELSLGCDFRLLSAGSPGIGLPETSVGILPGGGGTQRLPRLIGAARAMDLIIHSKLQKPDQALAIGLVHRVFPAASFNADAMAFCEDLAKRSPLALAAAKMCITQGTHLPLGEGLKFESREFGKTMQGGDAGKAMAALNRGDRSYKNAFEPFVGGWSARYPRPKL